MKKALLIMLAVLCAATSAFAAYPEKPIRLIVAYAPGGSNDILARITGKYLEKELGQPVVVENRSGSGGDVGFTAIANSDADGYTIGMLVVTPVIVNPITRPKVVRYTLASFAPICNLVTDPGIFCVAPESKYSTIEDLIADAKARPGEISTSHEGKGGGDHLGVLAFQSAADVKLNGVPYNGDAPAKAALLGGHIDMIAVNMSEVVDMVNEKQLRALAVQSAARVPELPDVPTFTEKGMNVIQASSRGLAAPAGVPEDIMKVLSDTMNKIAADPEYQAELKGLNMPMDFMDSESYKKFLDEQFALWDSIWKNDPWLD